MGCLLANILLSWSFVLLIHPGMGIISNETRLMKDLLANYDPLARPVLDSQQRVNISLGFKISQLLSLEEGNEVFTGVVWIYHHWHDDYLVWRPEDYGGLKSIFVGADKIWTPDLYIKELVGETHNTAAQFVGHGRELLSIRQNGSVYDEMPVRIEVQCPMDLTYFPFDMQTCSFTFRTWAYSDKEVKLHLGQDAMCEMRNAAWKVIKVTNYTNEPIVWDGAEYGEIVFNLSLARNPLYYLLNLIVPSYLVNGIMLSSVFIPAESGERISVGLTVFMAYSVFALILSSIVPNSATSPPIVCVFIMVNMVLSLLVNIWSVFVIRVHNTASSWGPPPQLLLKLLQTRSTSSYKFKNHNIICKEQFGTYLSNSGDIGRIGTSSDVKAHVNSNSSDGNETRREDNYEEWKRLTSIGDNLFALIFILVTIVCIAFLIYMYASFCYR